MFVCFFVIYLRIFNRFHVVTPVLLSICVSLTVFMLWHWCQPADTRHGVSPDTVSPGQDNMWWHPVPADTTCCPGARQSIPNSCIYTVTQWFMLKILASDYIMSTADSEYMSTVTVWWQNVALFALSPPPSLKAYCIRCLKLFYLYRIKHGGI